MNKNLKSLGKKWLLCLLRKQYIQASCNNCIFSLAVLMEKDCLFTFPAFIQHIFKTIENVFIQRYYMPNVLTSRRSESTAVESVLMPVLQDSRHWCICIQTCPRWRALAEFKHRYLTIGVYTVPLITDMELCFLNPRTCCVTKTSFKAQHLLRSLLAREKK